MTKQNPKVLVVATSRRTRGGITSVVKAHEQGEQWKKYHCRWIETYRDGNNIIKLWYLVVALFQYVVLLPFYDIVHIHIATTVSAQRKQIFMNIGKLLNKKIILHFHPSNEKFLFQPHNKRLYRKLFSKADLVIVLSEQWKKWIEEALGLSKNIDVLYNPCPKVNRREDIREKNILFAGTVIHRKRYEDLLNAFALITNKFPEWKVVFAGNGEIEKAKQIAENLKISEQVRFLGWVSNGEKDRAFQQASIYCMASEGEGFPMGVLDAWAYGIPCVMTPVGGITDIVTDGVQGLLFPVGDTAKLAEQLAKLISDADLRKSIVSETDKLAKNTLNLATVNARLDEIYENINGF
jgi:glycosyltransferase involved in cell wall biosynthesis